MWWIKICSDPDLVGTRSGRIPICSDPHQVGSRSVRIPIRSVPIWSDPHQVGSPSGRIPISSDPHQVESPSGRIPIRSDPDLVGSRSGRIPIRSDSDLVGSPSGRISLCLTNPDIRTGTDCKITEFVKPLFFAKLNLFVFLSNILSEPGEGRFENGSNLSEKVPLLQRSRGIYTLPC